MHRLLDRPGMFCDVTFHLLTPLPGASITDSPTDLDWPETFTPAFLLGWRSITVARWMEVLRDCDAELQRPVFLWR
eukprot:1120496-Prorocentrum_lima.AAC.1